MDIIWFPIFPSIHPINHPASQPAISLPFFAFWGIVYLPIYFHRVAVSCDLIRANEFQGDGSWMLWAGTTLKRSVCVCVCVCARMRGSWALKLL